MVFKMLIDLVVPGNLIRFGYMITTAEVNLFRCSYKKQNTLSNSNSKSSIKSKFLKRFT